MVKRMNKSISVHETKGVSGWPHGPAPLPFGNHTAGGWVDPQSRLDA